MENLELILSLASATLGLLLTTATFLAKFIKNAKLKKVAMQTIEICNTLMPFIEQAETFVNYSGAEKKEFVMTKANQYALEHNIKFNKELVSAKIEELINLSKNVNSLEKNDKKVFTIPAK